MTLALALHGRNTAMLISNSSEPWLDRERGLTDDKEDPLEGLAVLVGFLHGIERELKAFVVVVGQVQQDGGRFKDSKVVSGIVDESRNSTVGVDLEKPWFLGKISIRRGGLLICNHLLLIGSYVDLFESAIDRRSNTVRVGWSAAHS